VKFRTMVETSPDGVVTLNLDGAILYASKRALEEHGYLKENNLAGKKFWDLFSENDKLKVIKRFRDIEKIGVISNEEYLMIREDNSQFYGELSASLVKNEMGNANGYIVVTKDISQRKKNENAIIKYQKKLQSLVMELNLTEEKERRKIAVELHDHLGQNLAMAKIRLAALKNGNGHSENDDNYTEIEKHISHAIDYSRILTYELSPPVLFELGLVEAINWKLEQISENDDLKTNFIAETEISGLKEDYLILLFRSFSELVDNVIKHASAKYINVKIGIHNTVLIIEIEDDGKGFNPDSIYSSIYKTNKNGLFGIKERLEYYNGKLEISSQLGKGSKIKIIIPVISK